MSACLTMALAAVGELFGSEADLHERGKQAEELCSYEEAADIYRAIQESDSANHQTALRLAGVLQNLGKHREVVETIEPHSEALAVAIATSFLQLSQPEDAIETLAPFCPLESGSSEGLLLMGQALYLTQKQSEARQYFERVIEQNPTSNHRSLGMIYLARMALEEGKWESVLDRVLPLLSDSASPLCYEAHYLLGETHFQQGHYSLAIPSFEKALPSHNVQRAAWSADCLRRLTACHLAVAEDSQQPLATRSEALMKAHKALDALPTKCQEDDIYLLLGRCYLLQWQLNDDDDALAKAQSILSRKDCLQSLEARLQALVYLAKSARTYQERDSLLRRLIDESTGHTRWTAEAWHLRGKNDLSEGELLSKQGNKAQAAAPIESALYCFRRVVDLASHDAPVLASQSAILALQSYLVLDDDRANREALAYLETLFSDRLSLINTSADPDEFYYLYARIATRQPKQSNSRTQDEGDPINHRLRWLIDHYPQGRYADAALFLLASRHFTNGDLKTAQTLFEKLHSDYPNSPRTGDALYWQARCLEASQGKTPETRQLMTAVYTRYPTSLYAAEAYYAIYSPTEYLQGDSNALKHLEGLPKLFADSPYAVQGLLLIGLDYKRTRYTAEGKVLRKRNWIKSIETLQEAESRFETLYAQNKIPPEQLEQAIAARHRAVLERALTNLAVANESEGAKRHIYLEYSLEVLEKLREELESPNHPLTIATKHKELLSPLLDECAYSLALAHTMAADDDRASVVLNQLLRRCSEAKVTRGYYLSRARYQQGLIAKRAGRLDESLDLLAKAEEAAKGNVLNSDERLELWLERSDCYRQLGHLDKAMLELSRVINDDSISSHRLQAMVLRAEIYELQGRPELAQRQLEATARKGGRWAKLAQEKLNKDYRYD